MDRQQTNSKEVQKAKHRHVNIRAWLVLVCLAHGLYGCATASRKADSAFGLLRSGQAQQAVDSLIEPASIEGDDQLVYLLELGTAQQVAGLYKDSNQTFERANKLAEIQDYHSLSRIAGSLVVSERLMQYKGEDFEKVLINAMMAINYAALGDLDGALVEARRLNQKLYKYKFEAKRDYEQNPFARYMSAILYEADRNWDSAYIDYEETYKLNSEIPDLKPRLIWASRKAGRSDANAKWRRTFPDAEVPKEWDDKNTGELVLIYLQGQGPLKLPNPEFPRVPKLYPRPAVGRFARLRVEGLERKALSELVFNSEAVSIKTLDDAYAGLIAKRVAGVVTKAVVADQIRQKNELLGQLVWFGLNAADVADLRQWNSLPQTFQIARLNLSPGTYTVEIDALDLQGQPTGELSGPRVIEIKAGKKVFLPWRSFR